MNRLSMDSPVNSELGSLAEVNIELSESDKNISFSVLSCDQISDNNSMHNSSSCSYQQGKLNIDSVKSKLPSKIVTKQGPVKFRETLGISSLFANCHYLNQVYVDVSKKNDLGSETDVNREQVEVERFSIGETSDNPSLRGETSSSRSSCGNSYQEQVNIDDVQKSKNVPPEIQIKQEPLDEFAYGETCNNRSPCANSYPKQVNIDGLEKSKALHSEIQIKQEPVDFSFAETLDSQSVFAYGHCQTEVNISNPENSELYSDVLIKEEPGEISMETDMCTSEMDDTVLDTDNHNLHPIPLNQSVEDNHVDEGLTNGTSPDTVIVTSSGNSPFCPFCPGMKFVSETHLFAHNIEKHGLQVPADEDPLHHFSSAVNSASSTSSFRCAFCDFTCISKTELTDHLRTHTGKKSFQCTMCAYKCKFKGRLESHMRMHTNKPFRCTACSYTSKHKGNLMTHIKIHIGEKKFQCTMCDYKTNQRVSFDTHTRSHTEEKPFQCTVCDYKCKQKSTLYYHVKTHTGDKAFQCTMCDYKCGQRTTLTGHLRIHTGEKPFQCTVCDTEFRYKTNLTKHLRSRTCQKPFQCTICDFKCKEEEVLNKHTLTHSDPTPYQCKMCDFKCSEDFQLIRHFKTHFDKKPAQDNL